MNTLSVAEILDARPTAIQEIFSYVEKDVVLAAGIQKSREFLKVVRLRAGRAGQRLDFAER